MWKDRWKYVLGLWKPGSGISHGSLINGVNSGRNLRTNSARAETRVGNLSWVHAASVQKDLSSNLFARLSQRLSLSLSLLSLFSLSPFSSLCCSFFRVVSCVVNHTKLLPSGASNKVLS